MWVESSECSVLVLSSMHQRWLFQLNDLSILERNVLFDETLNLNCHNKLSLILIINSQHESIYSYFHHCFCSTMYTGLIIYSRQTIGLLLSGIFLKIPDADELIVDRTVQNTLKCGDCNVPTGARELIKLQIILRTFCYIWNGDFFLHNCKCLQMKMCW